MLAREIDDQLRDAKRIINMGANSINIKIPMYVLYKGEYKEFIVTFTTDIGTPGWGATVDDIPGGCCVAAGKTPEEVEKLILEAIPFHLEGIEEES